MDTTATTIRVLNQTGTPSRTRKRAATSPLLEIDVGSAHIQPILTSNPIRSTHSASTTGSVHLQTADKLLQLRKEYHHILSNLTKIDHHLTFLKQCKEENRIPKGLQMKVTPQAFLSSLTMVDTEFTNITKQAEESLRDILIGHYDTLHDHFNKQREELEKQMTDAEQAAPPQARETHQQIIDKTTSNMAKRKNILLDRANKKMEILRNPSLRPPRTRSTSRPNNRPNNRPKPQPQTSRNPPRINRQQRPQEQNRPNHPNRPNQPHNHAKQTQRSYTYAAATQGFPTGGPGHNNQPNQPTRQPLLPNPQTNPDIQQKILQTLMQLLQTLQR